MNIKIRQALAIVAFSAVVAAGITGATLPGETKETNVADACATVHWPMIPAACLEGGSGRDVRVVSGASTADYREVAAMSMTDRFAVAFQ